MWTKHRMDLSEGVDGLDLRDSDPSADIDALLEIANHQRNDIQPFYELEGKILGLWDQLNELKLEIAVFEAQKNAAPNGK